MPYVLNCINLPSSVLCTINHIILFINTYHYICYLLREIFWHSALLLSASLKKVESHMYIHLRQLEQELEL